MGDRCANATDTFECLVNVNEGTLQNANIAINLSGFFGTFVVVPVIDGEFITGSPSRQIESGRLNGVSDFIHRYPADIFIQILPSRNAFSQSQTRSKEPSLSTRTSQPR